tara:strand:+ start:1737 stop:2120 length:384 start_codon:yes stop_codon:yes gene_type:complete
VGGIGLENERLKRKADEHGEKKLTKSELVDSILACPKLQEEGERAQSPCSPTRALQPCSLSNLLLRFSDVVLLDDIVSIILWNSRVVEEADGGWKIKSELAMNYIDQARDRTPAPVIHVVVVWCREF